MTENSEHKNVLDAIERLLAGEQFKPGDLQDEESRHLLELARELHDNRPEPAHDFENRLRLRLEQAASASPVSQAQDQHRRRWLPRWLTLPRVAAVTAVLVLAVGVAGLTVALMGGRGPEKVTDQEMAAVQTDSLKNNGSLRSGEVASGIAEAPVDSEQPSLGTEDAAAAAAASIPDMRQVIRTADYEIEVPAGEFQDKYNQLTALATKYGGFVVSANTSASGDDEEINHGTVTIRVADINDNFNLAMNELDELGKVVSRDISGQDVTEEYVDLQSRLKNAQAHEASLLALMAKAQTIDEMLMVESELNSVRSDIEQLQGRINYLDNRTDYATITVDIDEQNSADEDSGDGADWAFVSSLKYAGWLAVQTLNFMIISLGIIVPVALVMILVTMAVYRFVQWRKS